MIPTLIILVGIATAFHFIYEGMIVPAYRIKLRYRLFNLRDELRYIKGTCSESEFKMEAFDLIDHSINSSIRNLSVLNYTTLWNAHKILRTDEKLREEAEKRVSIIENCENKEVRDIYKKVSKVAVKSFVLNIGGTFPYLIPPMIVLFFWDGVVKQTKRIIATDGNAVEEKFIPDQVFA